MEITGVENIIWLLFGGAAFFFVMHYVEVRAATRKASTGADETSAVSALENGDWMRDPVCGMRVDPAAGISWIHGERIYHFCSMSCRGRFRLAPEKFLRPVAAISRARETHAKS